jgi:hypothetical protein
MNVPPVFAGKARPLSSARPFRRCYICRRRHRSWFALANCVFPRAAWILGNPDPAGPCFAVVSNCPGGVTVALYATREAAAAAKEAIDGFGCGGRCLGRHEVQQLGPAAPLGVRDVGAVKAS